MFVVHDERDATKRTPSLRSYGSPVKERSSSPRDGQQRIVEDRDGEKHIEYFRNGSWRHSTTCKITVNKNCRK
jgi:hypothetical protein